jgi:hypothetical protein
MKSKQKTEITKVRTVKSKENKVAKLALEMEKGKKTFPFRGHRGLRSFFQGKLTKEQLTENTQKKLERIMKRKGFKK